MSEMCINYKNGTTKEIRLLNRFSNGEIRFVSESGERYMMTPDGTFAKDGVRIATKANEKGEIEYSGGHAYVVDDTIQSISYPSNTEFHYTFSEFSGVVTVRPGASKEEIKKAVDMDIYKQLRKMPVSEVQFTPGRIVR